MGVDNFWMQEALICAEQARVMGEVPVGAVLVDEHNHCVAKGWNQPISANDPSAHAEIVALREGGRVLNNYRLPNCTLYVTLEPCSMCLGAMIHARIKRVVFGAFDVKKGVFNHRINTKGGILESECATMLKSFFESKRESRDL